MPKIDFVEESESSERSKPGPKKSNHHHYLHKTIKNGRENHHHFVQCWMKIQEILSAQISKIES